MRNKVLILLLFAALFVPANALRAQTVILKADSITVPCHDVDTFLVPLRLCNFTNVAGLQFTLAWNPAHLDYAYITNINPAFSSIGFDTTTFIGQGKFTFSWTTIGGISLPDSSILLEVAFARLGGPATLVEFTDDPTFIAAIDPMGNDYVVETMPAEILPIDVEPPTVTCPANLTMDVFGPTPVNNIAPDSVLDNCAVDQIGWSSTGATSASFPNDPDASGAVFNLGQSEVTYLVTDIGGNTASCTFLIDLNLMPGDSLTILASNETANCGQTVTVEITALNFDSISGLQFSIGWDTNVISFASVENFNPTMVLDNSNFGTTQTGNGFLGFAWTTGLPGGVSLSNGSTLFTVTFNVVATSNASSGIQFGAFPTDLVAFSGKTLPPEEIGFLIINGSVTIDDNLPPVIQCPDNVSVMAPQGNTSAPVNGLEPLSLTDNCGGNPNLTYSATGTTPGMGTGPANGTYNAGTTTVTYTAADAAGNTATCSFTVIVDAGTPLTLMLDTVGIDCQSGSSQVAVDLTVLDFVDIIGLQFNVVWDTAILKFDSIGNQYPGLNLSPTMFFNFASTPNGTLQFFGGNSGGWPQIPDNETFFTIYFTAKSPNKSNIDFSGTIDAVDNTFNSVPVVTVNGCFQSIDLTPPVITCPMDTVVTVVGNECNANVMIDTAQATDACGGIQSITPDKTDDVYMAGTTVVTFTATDNSGNTATCSMTVTVQDNLPPQLFNCPVDLTVDVNSVDCAMAVTWTPPDPFDPCTGVTPNLIVSDTSGSVFPIGDTVVVYTAIDIFDDSTSCSFTITVRDSVLPTIVCLDDFQVVAMDSCSTVVDFSLPLTFDNCDQDIALTGGPAPGSVFPAGPTVVSYTAMDDFGNTATCSFTITVSDLNPPVLDTCPPDLTVMALPDSCGAMASWTAPGAMDDCDPDVAITADYTPGQFLPVGNTVVTYEAQDAGGNSASCSFTVTVQENVAPVISNCPPTRVFDMPPTKCDTLVNWTPPTAVDNCTLDTLIGSHQSGTVFPTGTHIVTYTAIDASGNTATCTFAIAVNDNLPPVFTSCPNDTIIVNASPCGEVVNWAYPTATDNCLLDTITSTAQPADTIFNNLTNVVVLAIDASGNADTCAFTITLDVIVVPPSFANFPADVMLSGCPQTVSWTPPTAGMGFCEPPIITAIPDTIMPGDTFPVGLTQIIYIALDSSGVERLRDTFKVTIIEDVPPAFIACPGNIAVHVGGVVLSDPVGFIVDIFPIQDCDAVELSFNIPAAIDNCGNTLVNQTIGLTSGNLFAADSTHTLVFTATDAVGNTSECTVQIQVVGLQPLNPIVDPPVACPNDEVILMVDSFPGAIYTWTGPDQSYPNNSQIIVIASPANAGLYTVSADINGCITPTDSTMVLLASDPVAEDDRDFEVNPLESLDSMNVLANDIFSPPSDFTVTFDTLPPGVSYLGNGLFSFEGASEPGRVSFIYKLCSNSCPDFCDEAVVVIQIRQTDCTVIPNIITPNGDGVNDYFTIQCLDTDFYNNNSLIIYNQWGDKVFEAAPYGNTMPVVWQGGLNGDPGKPLPDGVYFYIFKAGPNEPAQKGFVQIFR